LTSDEWRAEAKRRQQASLIIERAVAKIAARRRQQRVDEEGCGALFGAIRAEIWVALHDRC